MKMFIGVTATQTMESVAKEKKAGISMDGIFLSKLRSHTMFLSLAIKGMQWMVAVKNIQ